MPWPSRWGRRDDRHRLGLGAARLVVDLAVGRSIRSVLRRKRLEPRPQRVADDDVSARRAGPTSQRRPSPPSSRWCRCAHPAEAVDPGPASSDRAVAGSGAFEDGGAYSCAVCWSFQPVCLTPTGSQRMSAPSRVSGPELAATGCGGEIGVARRGARRGGCGDEAWGQVQVAGKVRGRGGHGVCVGRAGCCSDADNRVSPGTSSCRGGSAIGGCTDRYDDSGIGGIGRRRR